MSDAASSTPGRRRFDTVTFLSDLGRADEFVGVISCIVRDLAPHARVIDLTHDIAPFDVRAGSLALARAIAYVPSGVVLAAVDPGSDRPAVAVEVAGGAGILIGPDNGLLAPAVAMAGGAERAVRLTNAEFHLDGPGSTLVARDVLAPVAAHLCNGVDLAELGQLVDPDLLFPGVVPLPQASDELVIAQVLWIDRFGNAQLNVGPDDLPSTFGTRISVTVSSPTAPAGGITRVARRVDAYAAIGAGALGLVVDANALLALAMERRSAADEIGLGVGDQVTLTPIDDDAGDGTGAAATAQPVALGVRRRG